MEKLTFREAANIKILKPLFWEYDWTSVKQKLNSPFVIARVLELGNPQHYHLFSTLVGHHAINTFLQEKGERLLSPRSFRFWRSYYEHNDLARKS